MKIYSKKEKRKILFFLLILVTMGQIGIDLYLPSLPHIVQALKTDPQTIKFTLAFYLLGYGGSQVFYGPFSDTYGRKKVLYVGMLLYLLASIGCMFSQTAFHLILSRLFQGIGIGSAMTSTRSIMRDVFHGKKLAKVSSYLTTTWALILAIAPVVGGYIEEFSNWRVNFLILFLYALIWGIVFWKALPETNQHRTGKIKVKKIKESYRRLLSNSMFVAFISIIALNYGILVGFATISPFLFQNRLHFSSSAFGWLFCFYALGYVIGAISNAKLVHTFHLGRLLYYGIIISVLGSFLMLFFALFNIFTYWSVLAPGIIFAIGGGFVFTNGRTGALTTFRDIAATAGGLIGLFQVFGSFLSSSVAAIIPSKTALPLSIQLCILSTAMLVLYFLFIHNKFIEEGEEIQV